MKCFRFAVPVSLFLSVVLIFVGASAQADPMPEADEREDPQTAVVLRGSDFVVVDESSPAVLRVGESRFFPTGVIDQSTTVILVDGDFEPISARLGESAVSRDDILSLIKESRPGESPQPSRASRGYIANYGVWSQGYWGDNVIGMDDSTRVYYGFDVNDASWMQVCGQGRGYYRGYNGSDFGVWESWYSLGCTSTTSYGSAGASVPWGNVASTKRFKAYSTGVWASGSWW